MSIVEPLASGQQSDQLPHVIAERRRYERAGYTYLVRCTCGHDAHATPSLSADDLHDAHIVETIRHNAKPVIR